MIATFVIVLFPLLLIYWFSTRNHDYWKKMGIPYVKPFPFLGSSWETFTEYLHELDLKRYNELGPVYGYFYENRARLSVANPAFLRKILVKDFHVFPSRNINFIGGKYLGRMLATLTGEDWKRIRSIITPTLSTGKIKIMLNIFEECSRTLLKNFSEASSKGKSIDAQSLYGAFVMDVIASSAFSTKIDSHNDPKNIFVQMARKVSITNLNWKSIGLFVVQKLMHFLRFPVPNAEEFEFFKNSTLQIIEERKRTGQVRNDFLQLLMDTAKELKTENILDTRAAKQNEDIALNYREEESGDHIFKTVTSKNLSMDELVDQCVMFFIAGYDTSASTLSFASYLLAINPDIQDKLRKEVDKVLKESNGKLTYEAVQRMKYLDNIISETLRMFPAAIRLLRAADADYELDDIGLIIPKGMLLTIPLYAMHRDPTLFPDPEKFDPDRFTAEERAKRDQYAYLPFGAGPRKCIGMRFALMEIKVCLANVISTFIIKRDPETKVPLQLTVALGFLQAKDIFLKMEPRTDCPLNK